MNQPYPAPTIREWIGSGVTPNERRDIRTEAVKHAVYLHSDTGDAMAVLDRETAVSDVLKTADAFYQWITRDDEAVQS